MENLYEHFIDHGVSVLEKSLFFAERTGWKFAGIIPLPNGTFDVIYTRRRETVGARIRNKLTPVQVLVDLLKNEQDFKERIGEDAYREKISETLNLVQESIDTIKVMID